MWFKMFQKFLDLRTIQSDPSILISIAGSQLGNPPVEISLEQPQ